MAQTLRSRGCYISLEGIEGSGKSTQVVLVAKALGAVATREPGGTELGLALRHQLLHSDADVSFRSEALMMAADRAQHVEKLVLPVLESGQHVVTDRSEASFLAYQGAGRGLDQADLRWISRWASQGLVPDLYVLVDVPLEVAGQRRCGLTPDRIEQSGPSLQERVRDNYAKQVAFDPGRWLVVDGLGSPEEVAARVIASITSWMTDRGWSGA